MDMNTLVRMECDPRLAKTGVFPSSFPAVMCIVVESDVGFLLISALSAQNYSQHGLRKLSSMYMEGGQ